MSETADVPTIKAFISYSWSSPTHEAWVLTLASRLRQDGVDAILDKWDLQHGHDAFKFMEQMVTDVAVKKVIMICDRLYSEKADKREGGVGAESQIISPELYGKAAQDKFAAVITELDELGRASVPTFYKGRIYFDFSSDEKYEEQYDALLRWVLGKPLLIKPALGKPPAYIGGAVQHLAATDTHYRRVANSIRSGGGESAALFSEFSDALFADFEKLRLNGAHEENFEQVIVQSVQQSKVYVDQLLSLVTLIARSSNAERLFEGYIRTFEGLGRFMFPSEQVTSYTNWDFDNYKYLCHEIFLGSVAILLNEQCFDLLLKLLVHPYLIGGRRSAGRATESFGIFSDAIQSLQYIGEQKNRLRYQADLLRERHQGRSPNFVDLMQADFVLYLYGQKLETAEAFWEPVTLVFGIDRHRPFDIFARAESHAFFTKIIPILGGGSPEQFKARIKALQSARGVSFGAGYRVPLSRLANVENLAILP